jgi:hypothetical protein
MWEVLRIFGLIIFWLVAFIMVASLATALLFALGLIIMGRDDQVPEGHHEPPSAGKQHPASSESRQQMEGAEGVDYPDEGEDCPDDLQGASLDEHPGDIIDEREHQGDDEKYDQGLKHERAMSFKTLEVILFVLAWVLVAGIVSFMAWPL